MTKIFHARIFSAMDEISDLGQTNTLQLALFILHPHINIVCSL